MSYTTTISPLPKTHIGWNSIARLPGALEALSPDKILLIADPMLVKLGLHKEVTDMLDEGGYKCHLFSQVTPEPALALGQEIVDFARNNEFSLVIGFGGGSALDLAKLAAVLANNPGPVEEYLNLTALRKIKNKGITKILIPTTSGTGTEVTNISVLSLEQYKDAIVHDYLIADMAIVDPKFTLTIPPKITAATGADALTHAIEAYISVNRNPYSDGLALQAIHLIGKSLEKAVENGEDKQARENLSYGSYLAGLAFFNAGVGAVHALAYPLGGRFHIAHGESNAVLLPYVMHYIQSACEKDMNTMFQFLSRNTNNLTTDNLVQYLFNLLKKIGIPKTLKEYNIPENALTVLAEDAILQKRLLARCPQQLNRSDILKIYASAYSELLD